MYLFQGFKEAIQNNSSDNSLDIVAILEVLNRYFILGDRTILKNVSRAPWMGKPNENKETWQFATIPDHDKKQLTPEQIASELFILLCNEIKNYVKSHEKVGILLSGGMDSRMVAGILHHLVKHQEIEVKSITAYTWGNEDSRDVVYAKRIADHFNWNWKHFQVTVSHFWDNIKIAGERGCEYTGFHLHAIPQISGNLDVDIMLAGSYGDSVGRAEYSGMHVTKLRAINDGIKNPAYLLKEIIFEKSKAQIEGDLQKYHNLFPRKEPYQQHEVDYQCHYMRRMLNPCMELINEKIPFRQAFTDPKVFGYMWGLDPSCRNDEPYKYLLSKLDPFLSEIPWARTGKRYLCENDISDTFKKKHHSYDKFVQEYLLEDIASRLFTYKSQLENIFNFHAIEKLLQLIRKGNGYNFDFLEKILWLTSFTFFLEKYDIKLLLNEKYKWKDTFNAQYRLPLEYNFLRRARKLKKIF